MKQEKILTENPYEELWLSLSYFENYYNCYNYLKQNHNISKKEIREKRASIFQYYIKQAHEYYNSSLSVSLLTQPTLLYYGALCLSRGLFLAKMSYKDDSSKHGIKEVKNNEFENLMDFKIKVTKGSFLQFYRTIYSDYYLDPDEMKGTEWTLKELLSMIPELKDTYEDLFNQKSLAIKVNRFFDEDGEYIKINENFFSEMKEEEVMSFFSNINKLSEFYLSPKFLSDSKILFHKKASIKDDLTQKNLMGEEYLIVGIEKNNKFVNIPDMAIHLMILFLLSVLSRYHVNSWGKGSLELESGDFYIIKKFLRLSTRKFPNLILNELKNAEHIFTSELYKPIDIRIDDYKEQISEMIKDIKKEEDSRERSEKLFLKSRKESKHGLWD